MIPLISIGDVLMEKISAKTVLFDKAMDLFRKNGYENVTVSQICTEADVTRNAFYYYFNSKEEILSSYFENIPDFAQSLIAELLAIPNDWDKLWFLFEAHLKLIKREGLSICRAFISVNVNGCGDLLSKYYVSEAMTVPLVKNCQKAGLIRNMTEPNQLIYLATRLMAGFLLTWCCKNGEFDLLTEAKRAFFALMMPTN